MDPQPSASALPPSSQLPGQTRSSGFAVASLVLGIFSCLGGIVFLVPPIVAIVFGHVSVSQCNRNRALAGRGMGIAGLVLGYASLVLLIPGLLAATGFKIRSTSQDKAVASNARGLSAAADQYFLEHGVTTVRLSDLVGSENYLKTFGTVAGERYPEHYTRGVTITVQSVAGTRIVTYVP